MANTTNIKLPPNFRETGMSCEAIVDRLLSMRPYPGIALAVRDTTERSVWLPYEAFQEHTQRRTDTCALDCMIVLLRALAPRGLYITGWSPGPIRNFMALARKNMGKRLAADMGEKAKLVQDCYGILTVEDWEKYAFVLSHLLLKAKDWKGLLRENSTFRIKSQSVIYTYDMDTEFEKTTWHCRKESLPQEPEHEPYVVWDGTKSLEQFWDEYFQEYTGDIGGTTGKTARIRPMGLGPNILLVIFRPQVLRTFQDLKTFQMRFAQIKEQDVWLQDGRYNIGAIVKDPASTHPAIRIYKSASELPESDEEENLSEKQNSRREPKLPRWTVGTIEPGAEFFLFYHNAGLEHNISENEICEEFVITEDETTQDSTSTVVAPNEEDRKSQRDQKEAFDGILAIADPKYDLIRIVPRVTSTSTSTTSRPTVHQTPGGSKEPGKSGRGKQPTAAPTGDSDREKRRQAKSSRSGGSEVGDRNIPLQPQSSRSGGYKVGDGDHRRQARSSRSGDYEASDRYAHPQSSRSGGYRVGDGVHQRQSQSSRSGGYETGDRNVPHKSQSSRSGGYKTGDRNVDPQSSRSGGYEADYRNPAHAKHPPRPTGEPTMSSSLVLYEDPKPRPSDTDEVLDQVIENHLARVEAMLPDLLGNRHSIYPTPFQLQVFAAAKRLGHPALGAWIDAGLSAARKPEKPADHIEKLMKSLEYIKNIDLKVEGNDYQSLIFLSGEFYSALWTAWREEKMKPR